MTSLPSIDSLYKTQKEKKEIEIKVTFSQYYIQKVQLLKNRIAMLKMKQVKTLKDTRKKEENALNIYQAKIRVQEQKAIQKERQTQNDSLKGFTYEMKKEQDKKNKQSKQLVQSIKKMEAKKLKEFLQQEEKQKEYESWSEYQNNLFKANKIKFDKFEGKKRIIEMKSEYKMNVRKEIMEQTFQLLPLFNSQIEQVNNEIKRQNYLLSFFDEQENFMIKDIQRTQELQQVSMNLFKQAQSLPPKQFKKKYINNEDVDTRKYNSQSSKMQLQFSKTGQPFIQQSDNLSEPKNLNSQFRSDSQGNIGNTRQQINQDEKEKQSKEQIPDQTEITKFEDQKNNEIPKEIQIQENDEKKDGQQENENQEEN